MVLSVKFQFGFHVGGTSGGGGGGGGFGGIGIGHGGKDEGFGYLQCGYLHQPAAVEQLFEITSVVIPPPTISTRMDVIESTVPRLSCAPHAVVRSVKFASPGF